MSAPIRTRLAVSGDEFKANAHAMGLLVAHVRALHDQVLAGGGPHYVERHRSRGKMMVRERLEALVDPGTPLLELCPLAGLETGDPLGGGVAVALGQVARTQCLIIANDPTVRGGTTSPTTIKKLLRAMDVAETNRLPLVLLVESGGADLPRQADVFVPGGEQFRRLTQLSAAGHPDHLRRLRVLDRRGRLPPGHERLHGHGRRAGPGLPGRPPAGEDGHRRGRRRGGARRRRDARPHVSGLCDYLAARRGPDALRIGPRRSWPTSTGRVAARAPDLGSEPPLYPAEELARRRTGRRAGAVRRARGPRPRASTARGSRSSSRRTGPSWSAAGRPSAGYPIGVLANNGILFSEEAQKGAQFIQLCNRSDTPILFVQNITGFMVGTRYEQGGIIKDGAKLINAVSNSTVPHLTLMVGASYGAGNYAMAGRAYDPRFVFTWPNHRIAVMGPKQLAGVLSIVRRNAAEAAGRPFDEQADEELRAGDRGADRRGVDRPVRHGPPVGRRHHRPARHAHGARHRIDRGPLRPRRGHGASSASCGTDGAVPAAARPGGQPGGDRPAGHQGRPRHGDRGGRRVHVRGCGAPRTSGRPTSPSTWPGRTLAETYLNPGALVALAGLAGADAIHPGLRVPLRESRTPRSLVPRPGSSGWGRRRSRCGSWGIRCGARRRCPLPAYPCSRAQSWPGPSPTPS